MKTKGAAVAWYFSLVVTLLLAALAEPAEARGRGRGRGGRGGVLVLRASPGFYGFWGDPFFYSAFRHGYYGYPYYGRYAGSAGELSPALAKALGVGALDLNVKPRSADVFVDGTFLGKVRDFNGYPARPSYLWLDEGEHTVAIFKGGYATFEQTFDIQGGVISGVKLKLLPGSSEPPDSPAGEGAEGPST